MSDRATNRLAKETSAYLRQHMHNPVDWHPWGEEALALAQKTDKPILISIGYSACHWCHVMEHESFEDPQTAALMNERFVNIKVDREERPDVDQIYMDTVVRLTGHGGWPLTVFCRPDGSPFYGGTYFPPEPRHNMPAFSQVLGAVSDAYRDRRDEVDQNAAQILEALAQEPEGVAQATPGAESVATGAREILRGADPVNGGFGGAPKFPTPTNLELLLCAVDFLPEEGVRPVLAHCLHTCREMARRGLYDHLGGGFHRYCVDDHWGIPHFEKMLYDQGLLLRVYAETARRTQSDDADLEWPLRETAAFLRREMAGGEGGWFASQDADSEGEEGRFYVWRPAEIESVLGAAAGEFATAYGVGEQGNFEGGTTHLIDRARQPREHLAEAREALLKVRNTRIAPGTDRKRVAAWNGYVISGLARAGSWLRDAAMIQEAATGADFVLGEMLDESGGLQRIFDGERARVPAFLDDHAALLDACLDLHRAGAGDRFLGAAARLAGQIADRFYDADEKDLFLTPADGERLIHRPRSDHDGATPQAAGLATLGLLRAGELAGRSDWGQVASSVIRRHAFLLERMPHAYPTLLRAVALQARGLRVAVIIGEPEDPAALTLADRARRDLSPEDAVLVARPGEAAAEGLDPTWLDGRGLVEGEAALYLCRGQSCSLPIRRADEFTSLL